MPKPSLCFAPKLLPVFASLLLASSLASADVKIGVIASSTGVTAVVGIPYGAT